jgi:hypothetical protein
MYKRLICLISFVLVLALTGSASADLVAHWSLDNDATDSVGSLDWTLNAGAGYSTDAKEGSHSLSLDGTGAYLSQTAVGPLLVEFSTKTVALWFKTDSASGTGVIFDEGGTTRGLTIRASDGNVEAAVRENSTQATVSSSFAPGVWTHVAATFDNGLFKLYVQGAEQDSVTAPFTLATQHSNTSGLGARAGQDAFGGTALGDYFGGLIDDVRMYDNALSAGEIAEFAGGYPQSYNPTPGDGAIYASTWANLAWTGGTFAVSHDVYFGTTLNDVNDGAEGTFVGNTASTFQIVGFPGFPVAEGLAPGTTYYWRVDEVNDADPNSPWKGDVWSFAVPPRAAYNLVPADRAKFQVPDLTLSWTGGFDAKLHHVYFGENAAAVEAGGATYKGPVAETTYTPGTLELDKVYYWRIDEFDGVATHKGDVSSFQIRPSIPVTDPDLIVWWRLDEGQGSTVLDWSGHGNDATFTGEPQWAEGFDGSALNIDGAGQSVIATFTEETWSAYTLALWAKADVLWQSNNSSISATHTTTANGFQISFDTANSYQYHASNIDFVMGPASTSWIHLALSYDGTMTSAYYDGNLVGTFMQEAIDVVADKFAIGVNRAADNWFDGVVDDFRVYGKALTQEEVQLVMRIDPLLAWNASPTNGSTPDIDAATPLTWSPGDGASRHEVYFGADEDAVDSADSSDAAGIYRGSQNGASFTPAEGVEWGGGPYYWRVDENNNNGTVTKGRVWSFTVADFVLVDDFESYTDNDADNEAIWQHWIDGFGVPANGAQAGYLLPPYAEPTIINGGGQSMPLAYDNRAGVRNSEAELALTAPRDWTRHGVQVLSLWFRGYAETVSSFTEGPAGSFTMTTRSGNAWGTSDQINYVFKQLTGAGSISLKVESITNTAADAKAGVMIRETLDPDSKHAFTFFRPDGGVRFNRRLNVGDVTANSVENGFSLPRWVKLERDASGRSIASHSADGNIWVPVNDMTNGSFDTVGMNSSVYIGFALAGNNIDEVCEFKFSDVQVTGAVAGQWQQQDVGVLANAPEPLYVALSNSNGTSGVVVNGDANASVTDVWTEWLIDLSEFANQGVNLSNVGKIAIGLGATGDANATGGSGTMFIDDIRLLRPAPQQTPTN